MRRRERSASLLCGRHHPQPQQQRQQIFTISNPVHNDETSFNDDVMASYSDDVMLIDLDPTGPDTFQPSRPAAASAAGDECEMKEVNVYRGNDL